ncbi:MAG TPA: type II secretion system F family protein [Hyphomicrobiaceae bacterium]|jgi:tight adherence protein C|nr:type II secretion system F family protein [Hyphomicrobiaceae bacterium]
MLDNIMGLLTPQIVVTLLAAIAAFATALTVLMPVLSRDRLATRMQVMATERDKMRASRLADLAKKEGQGRLRIAPKGFMQDIVERFNLRSMFETEEVRDKLKMAGLRGQAPLVAYLFFRLAMPIIIAVIALVYLFLIAAYEYPPLIKVGLALVAGYLGFYLPNMFVENLVQRRQTSIKNAFPDALDMLLICVQSGMSVEAGFAKVASEVGSQSLELAEELSLTTAELSYLQERRQAFENLGKRTGIAGIKAVATALIQAERYGTPVGQALRVMARENRDMRMAEAEKKAAALPPKLTVPMIVFFLPVLFVVILGPAIIQVFKYN